MATREEPRPLEIMRRCMTAYPRADRMATAIHEAWSRHPEFREWSYIPAYDATEEIVSSHGVRREKSEEELDEDFVALEAVLRWRLTKGVYAFDPEIFVEVGSTPHDGELPIELFFRLPERCVYVAVPPGVQLGEAYVGLRGFFVHLGWDERRRMTELAVTLDYEHRLQGFSVDLAAPTLAGCLAKWGDVLADSPIFLDKIEREYGEGMREKYHDSVWRREQVEAEAAFLSPFLSLILYLCAANAEIAASDGSDRRPENPAPRRTKKRGDKLFAAREVREWSVAYRIGAALRRARAQEEEQQGRSASSPGDAERRNRAHVRRAHWHTYWTGPRAPERADERRPILKWLPPIAINVDDADDLPAVVRRVQ